MKTIEERAWEYVGAHCTRNCSMCRDIVENPCEWMNDKVCFTAGANSEHRELTRWNSPNDYPADKKEVLAKIEGGYYKVVVFDFNSMLWEVSGTREYIQIYGWREIHE